MDHLPLPLDQVNTSLLEVPLHTREGYDHDKDFLGYPDRQGWNSRSIAEWEHIFEDGSADFRGFLQRWLFFGTLELLSDQIVDIDDFTNSEGGTRQPLLSTRSLHKFPVDLTRMEEKNRDAAYVAFLESKMLHQNLTSEFHKSRVVNPNLASSTRSLTEYIQGINREKARMPDPRDARVVVADEILHETIFAQVAAGTEDIRRRLHGYSEKKPWEINVTSWTRIKWAWQLLIDRGWCRSSILKRAYAFNTSGLLYLSRIEPPLRSKDHSDCSTLACKYLQLNEDTYETKHAGGCNGCGLIHIDCEELSDIFESGSFPVVWPFDEDDENIKLTAWFPELAFVALSHVWSDGLGDVDGNSLPRCQLLRLTKLISRVDGPTPFFWLDTLCVPPDSANVPYLQGLALARMRDVYEKADYVLVIDSWLLSTPAAMISPVERMLRILSCTWNQRLWTYQEAAIAQNLRFVFPDGIFDIDVLIDDISTISLSNPSLVLKGQILRGYAGLRHFRQIENEPGKKLVFLMDAMRLRSTSVASDESLCLSTLMGLDTEKIFETRPDDRMLQFWSMLDSIPRQALDDQSPKLKELHFSWAPESLLLNGSRLRSTGLLEHSNISQVPSILHRNSEGLHYRGPGMQLPCGKLPLGRSIHIKDGEEWLLMTTSFDRGLEHMGKYTDVNNQTNSNHAFDCLYPFQYFGTEDIYFIFNDKGRGVDENSGTLNVLHSVSEQGMMFVKKIGWASCVTLKNEASGNVKLLDDWDARWGESAAAYNTDLNPCLFVARARRLSDKHEWCYI
ncbi:unnamed protein product [Alternaria alternata]